MPTVKTLKLVNPRKSHRKRNGVIYLMSNPRRKKSRNRHHHSAHNRHHRSHAKNPFSFRRRHHRARNPIGHSASDIMKLGFGAFAGVIGSGYLSQMILGTSNTGIMGYAGDAVATLAIAWAANKFAGGKVAEGVLAGGIGALIKRYWQENVAGNVAMNGYGNTDYLGAYSTRNYALPSATAGGSYQLQPPPGSPVASTAAVAGAIATGKGDGASVGRFKRWN